MLHINEMDNKTIKEINTSMKYLKLYINKQCYRFDSHLYENIRDFIFPSPKTQKNILNL